MEKRAVLQIKVVISVALIAVIALLSSMTAAAAGTHGTYGKDQPGYMGGFWVSQQEGHVMTIDIVGTARFDLLVVDDENEYRYFHNMSFDYVHSLSRLNVTSAHVA